MVKPASFFQRLKERIRGTARVEAAPAAPPTNSPVQRFEAECVPGHDIDSVQIEPRSTHKLSDREEALIAVGGHFQELTAMLRGSQARTDDHLDKLVASTATLAQLPGLSQQHLEALRTLAAQMERQHLLGEQLSQAMAQLPGMLQSVERAMARAAAADERTSSVVAEFCGTLATVQSAMGRMVDQGEQHVLAAQGLVARRDQEFKDLTEGIQITQLRAANELHRATEEGMASLRTSHEDQSNRLQRIVQESASWNRAVLFGLAMVSILVVGVLALIIFT
ncbi:MAG: hypothetical protein FJ301_03960 [Planctomycetes bacterium]|nr:hypothetical protein [Planctomycetota bacterium]